MAHEDFVTLEQADTLKELGFDWKCKQGWVRHKNGKVHPFTYNGPLADYDIIDDEDEIIYKPTLAQVQKWLREKEIEVGVFAEFDGELRTGQWVWLMRKFNTHLYDTVFSEDINYESYEQALSEGIDKALALLKEND